MLYDMVTVGGGLAGATLAKQMAERGYRVLVLEREREFKDRVRGEQMHPWGVIEARALGIYDPLCATCGHQTRWWTTYQGGEQQNKRDLQATTPHQVGSFNCYHPAMQECLIGLAAEAGALVWRGTKVTAVVPGESPTVHLSDNGISKTVQARLVVGADGRNSQVRHWGGFTVQHDLPMLVVAGALFEGASVPDDAVHVFRGQEGVVLLAPLGSQKVRMYFIYHQQDGLRPLSGKEQIPDFLQCCRQSGVPWEWFEKAEVPGPLAQFQGADHWVNHPARDGVALVGDAAAASDPSFGCGLSLSLLDVRHLRDVLLRQADWQNAIQQYANEHDQYYGALHRIIQWTRELVWQRGAAADERRARVMPRLATERQRAPDIVGLGPASPNDEATRRFLLDEEDPVLHAA